MGLDYDGYPLSGEEQVQARLNRIEARLSQIHAILWGVVGGLAMIGWRLFGWI